MWDNKIFDVNGRGDEMLAQALELIFAQHGKNALCKGYAFRKDSGLYLHWTLTPDQNPNNGVVKLPGDGMTAKEITPLIAVWLRSAEAKSVTLEGPDYDLQHDGDNGEGWRIIGMKTHWSAICVVRPVFLWYGK